MWRFYNRRVLAFAPQATVPCVVMKAAGIADAPGPLAALVGEHLGVDLDPTGVSFDHAAPGRLVDAPERLPIPWRERLASERLWWRIGRMAVTG